MNAQATPAEPPELARFHSHLLDVYKTISTEFAKAIMLLSGGALGLSLTFLGKLESAPSWKALLCVAWILLTLSLAMVAYSMLRSMKALYAIHDRWQDYVAGKYTPEQDSAWVKALNGAAVFCLCFGLLSLCFFAFANTR
jgi:hypothetical protein